MLLVSRPLPIRVDPQARIPLATQVTQQLTWLIASGDLEHGAELPPARDLAATLGINVNTVRAAYQQLGSDGLVSVGRGRRARVLSYDRTLAARASGGTPSFSIGVIIPMFVPFYAPLIDGIEKAAEHPVMLFICNARDDPEIAVGYLDRLIARQVDGIVAAAPLLMAGLSVPLPDRPPVVFVDAPGVPTPNVQFDLEEAQYQATSHLVGHGHRRVGLITAPLEWPHVAPKFQGHTRALREVGLEPAGELTAVVPDFAVASGTDAANRLLDLPDPPTAIAAIGDDLAIGAYHAITARGLGIPEDVALTGNDGSEMAALIRPALTTVALPVREAGEQAIGMLEHLIAGDGPEPLQVILGVELAVGESCGCGSDHPRSGDPARSEPR